MLTRRPVILGSVGLLLAMGLEEVGHGAWIYLKAELAQFLLQRAWVRTLRGAATVQPWPWADTWPVARLTVPRHGVDLIVLAGANGRTLAFGPGHRLSSAAPGGVGVTVVTGHRDTHFRFLSRLRAGDEIRLRAPELGQFRYRVRSSHVVDARTTRLLTETDERTLILVTCYPFDAIRPGGPLRYVVVSEEIPRRSFSPDPDPSNSSVDS